jgi:prophage tail gpP-like protein
MSEGGRKIFEKTTAIDDAVTLYVDKQIYEGWEDVQITRELNSAASDFQLQLTDKWRPEKETWRLVPGQSVHIHAGKRSVLTGYIDKISASVSASSRRLTISGRSKTGDLVDCSIEKPDQVQGLTLKAAAQKLCAPFGIQVTFLASEGAAFANLKVQPGETVFSFLDKACRQRKLLMYPSVEGGLVFAQGGTTRAKAELRQGLDGNILSGSMNYDFTNRFSKYVGKGQNLAWLGDAEQGTSPSGSAVDEGVTRYRPLVIMNEQSGDDASIGDRATHEAKLRAAQALEVEVQVQGWFQAPDVLWDVNQLVRVDSGFLGVRREMLIKKVSYSKGASTTATLTLVRKDAFDFSVKGKVKKEDSLGWTKLL